MRINLTPRPPFSLTAVAKSHGWMNLAPFDFDESTTMLSYISRLKSGQVLEVCIRETEEGIEVETSQAIGAGERERISEQVNWMLGLDQDFSQFYRLARQEPKLAHVPEQALGRVLRCPTLFEDVVKTILTTNTSWSGTIRMVDKLVSTFGEPLPSDETRHAFPTPDQIAASDEQQLRSQVKIGYRAPYVLELARGVSTGEIELETLKDADIPAHELHQRLSAIKGVGAYSTANLMMLLGHYDFLPVDSWARKVVSFEWYDGEPVRDSQVEEAFEHWGKWKGLAFWFWNWSYFQQAG